MTDKSFVLSIRFKGDVKKVETIYFLEEIISRYFNISFKEINVTTIDKTLNNWKLKNRMFKFKKDNIKKIEEIVNSNDGKNVDLNFELITPKNDYTFKSRDVELSVAYQKSDHSSSVNFVVNSQLLLNASWMDFIEATIDFLRGQNCKIMCGFLFLLENLKMPSFYVEGISSGELSISEQEKLSIWRDKKDSCETKIWDVFGINIWQLNKNKSISVNEIVKIVGNQNVKLLSDDLIIVKLKEELNNFDILKYSGSRKNLFDYFQSENLII